MNTLLNNELLFSSEDSDSDDGRPLRKLREFKPRINFDQLTDFQFNESFRISKSSFEYVLERVGLHLRHQTLRNYALNPTQQLLTTLHWLGNGSQYHGISKMHGISKSSVHRCIVRVVNVVVDVLFSDEVKWPTENIVDIPQKFMELANFPRVAGCVDGTLIQIDGPGENENAFVDRKGDHSINAMVVAGPQLEFYYASAKWPGSVSDARVLRNSRLHESWVNGWRPFINAILLGDSIYPLQTWLMTPFVNGPLNQKRLRYLRAHRSTRRVVECAIGGLKEKFPCLNYLRVDPTVAGKIFLSCVTFYNIEKKFKTLDNNILLANFDALDEEEIAAAQNDGNNVDGLALDALNEIIDTFDY